MQPRADVKPDLKWAGGKRQLLFWSAESLNSLDPETGTVYWTIPIAPNNGRTACLISTDLMRS